MFTRFNDALLLASKEQFGPVTKSRRAVIVLSDGIDNGQGTTTLEDCVAVADQGAGGGLHCRQY